MVRSEPIDLALSYIEEPGAAVVMQIPFARDLELVHAEVFRRSPFVLEGGMRYRWEFEGGRTVFFEFVSSDTAGVRWACPVVLIERLSGELPAGIW